MAGMMLCAGQFICFPLIEPRLVQTLHLFSEHTRNGQLGDLEEIFSESDKKTCMGLELLIPPLSQCFTSVFHFTRENFMLSCHFEVWHEEAF